MCENSRYSPRVLMFPILHLALGSIKQLCDSLASLCEGNHRLQNSSK